ARSGAQRPGEFGCKARLPNAAHAQHRHQLTTLLDHTAIQLSQLLSAADEATHIRRLTPILPPFACWRLGWCRRAQQATWRTTLRRMECACGAPRALPLPTRRVLPMTHVRQSGR